METSEPFAIQSTEIQKARKSKSSYLFNRFDGARPPVAPKETTHRPSLPSIKSPLQRKLKRTLVQPRIANHLPANTRAEYGFEHVLLEPPDDRIMLEQIHNGRMTFENSLS